MLQKYRTNQKSWTALSYHTEKNNEEEEIEINENNRNGLILKMIHSLNSQPSNMIISRWVTITPLLNTQS